MLHRYTRKLHSPSHRSHLTFPTSIWTSHRASPIQGRPIELSMSRSTVQLLVTVTHAPSNLSNHHWRTFKIIKAFTKHFRKMGSKVLMSVMTSRCIASRGELKQGQKVRNHSRNKQTVDAQAKSQKWRPHSRTRWDLSTGWRCTQIQNLGAHKTIESSWYLRIMI